MADVKIDLDLACGTEIKNGLGLGPTSATLTISRACAEKLWIATGNVLRGPSGKKKQTPKAKTVRKRKLGGPSGGRNTAGG